MRPPSKPDGPLLDEPVFYSFSKTFLLSRTGPLTTTSAVLDRFLAQPGRAGFWHETSLMRGGMEATYADVGQRLGFAGFASTRPAHGAMYSARQRLRLEAEPLFPLPVRDDVG